jgi:hypothetical protein
VALAWCALLAAPVRAETTACTVIASLPAVLDVPGRYCLESDFTQSLNTTAIVVTADDVVVDCNGHRIRNTLNTNGAAGISLYDRNDSTVRNCVVDGFMQGINLSTSTEGRGAGNLVEGNVIVNTRQVGIAMAGSHNLIVGNRITRMTGNYNGVVYGIQLVNFTSFSVGNVFRDNVISDFQPTPPPGAKSYSQAIYIGNGRQTVIEGNTISGLYPTTGAFVYAIESYGFEQVVRNNTVLAPQPLPAPWDGAQSAGIILFGDFTPESQANNACEGNTVGGFTTAISGCVKSNNTEF